MVLNTPNRPDWARRIRVGRHGTFTLPADLRAKYGIKEGNTFYLLDLDGIFVLTPMVSLVPELAREIEQLRVEAGLSTQELLVGLCEQRAKYRADAQPDAAKR